MNDTPKTRVNLQKLLFFFFATDCLVLAQVGSYLINSHLAIGETYVVNGVIHLTHVRNFGGVFGTFQGFGGVFAVLSAAVLLGLAFFAKIEKWDRLEVVCFALILGGGASNICDRLIYGSVIDFIDVQGIPYWHYIFNTADVMIHVGIWPLVLRTLIKPKPAPAASAPSQSE